MNRVKQRAVGSYMLSATVLDDTSAQQTVTAPMTVTVYDGAGVKVAEGVPDYSDGTLTFEVDAADLPLLDTYSVVWTGTVDGDPQEWTTELELVGRYLFEVADLRAFDRAFADATKYPSAVIRELRAWVEDTIEQAANIAFVPRGARCTLDGTNANYAGWAGASGYHYVGEPGFVSVPHFAVREVYAASVSGSALTSDQVDALTVSDDLVYAPGGWPYGRRNVTLHYAHGLDRPPGPIVRAALILAREYLAKSDLPGRATATTIGDQTFRITIAGRDGATGLPEVDAAISQFGRVRVGLG